MNGGYDTLASLSSEVVKQFADAASFEGIKSRGWFIKHDKTGVGDQLDTDGGTLALSAGKNLAVDGTDLAVGEVGQPEVFHDLLDELVLVFLVGGKFQTRRKCERLFNGKVREEHVVLHDVRNGANGACQRYAAGRHRFEERVRQALAFRWKHKHIGF